jgi:hypothetical protein
MKIILLLAVLMMFSGCAHCNGGWSTLDTSLEAGSQALMFVDYKQTLHIADNPNLYEQNPVLGKHPSDSKVNLYYAIWAPLHAAVSCMLAPRYRTMWQSGTIGVEGVVVLDNGNLGLKW